MEYQERLLKAIPGGAHTYSRGFDQFPQNAPKILKSGKGVYIIDGEDKEYLDYGMALRAVNIGYSEERINSAAIKQIQNGNSLTRPSMVELEAAELMIDLIDSVEMVKFTKNGSSAVSAAVKLARAYTGRNMVLCCEEHPFFSYDDWFISSTPLQRGIPPETAKNIKTFNFNNIASLEKLITEHKNEIACVVLEPAATEEPINGYLSKVQSLCNQNGIVFILDEMITGFRYDIKGAQYRYGVNPDLCTFGKAMANGFSIACVGGKREIMQLGSIEFKGAERVFLLSTTHGAEMSALGAFLETVNYLRTANVIDHLWDYGAELVGLMSKRAGEFGLEKSFILGGADCSPYYKTLDLEGNVSMGLRTLFSQEMLNNGILMPWISLAYKHGEREMKATDIALNKAFEIYRKALNEGVEKYLIGPPIQPVFRKFN